MVLSLQYRRQLAQILAMDFIAPHVAGSSGSGYGIPSVHLLVHYVRDLAATAVTLDASKAFITISFSTDNTRWTSLASVVCSGLRIGQLLFPLAWCLWLQKLGSPLPSVDSTSQPSPEAAGLYLPLPPLVCSR